MATDPTDVTDPIEPPGSADSPEPVDASASRTAARDRAARLAPLVVVGLLAGVLGVLVGWRAAAPPTAADPDRGFVIDMVEHHRQAVQLAEFALAASDNPSVQALAAGIISDQRYEIGWMESWLTARGIERPAPDDDRTVMAWMSMPVPRDQMPGLIPSEEVVTFLNLGGEELDRRFLELMIEHHEGGVHMASWEAAYGLDPALRSLAGRMVVTQSAEINDMRQFLG